MASWEIFLFGPPRVAYNNHAIAVSRRKTVALLAYLAVEQRPHSRETLATLMWPEHTAAQAKANLRRDLSRLKNVLSNDVLVVARTQAAINPDGGWWLDVQTFQEAVQLLRNHNHFPEQQCAKCLKAGQEASQLYTADFMAGFTLPDSPGYDEWQFFTRESLRQSLAEILQRLLGWHINQTEFEQAIEYGRRWLAMDTLHEPAHRELMQLYAWAGQQAAAIRQYEECVRHLDEELGVPPEPETEALYEAIFARKLSPPTVKKLERPIREAAVSRAIPSGGERYETGELLAEGGQSLGDVIVGVGEQRAADGLVAELTTATWGQKPVHHNLPVQRATFFGRQNELVEIQKHLLETKGRLISIIGPGGIGKTRLAITAGAELAAHFPQGVFLVPLAPLETADQILSALAEILGVQNLVADNPRLQLLNYLKRKQTLLIFDNYEHLLPQVDFVADIAATAPNVQLIVTTRERLNLGAELVYTLKGMTYPTLTDSEPEKLATYDAVQLLVGQAQMARPDVSLKPEDFKYINRICNLVQGMPLALVLAASWLDMLSFAEIAEEIANSLDFLESERGDLPPRQRSVRAVFNGSWSRLPTAAQETFARLTVFRGGFTREAARAVCKTSLRDLRVLVNSSFVTVSANGRYEVHELMRQLGAEQLAAMGTAAATNTDHSNYYLSFLHKREADLKGRRQIEALEEILEDFDNVRSAWNWALEQGNRQGIDQAQECLHLFFDIQGRYGEGRSFFSRAKETLAIPPGSKVDSIYGRILTRYAFLGIIIGRPRDMIAADLKQGLAIAIENEDRHEMAINYMAQSSLLENPPADLESFEQAKNIFEELNDDFYLSRACAALSNCYGVLLNLEKAKYYIEEAVRIARSTGSVVNLSLALGNLAEIEIAFGQYDVAQQHIQESSILGLKTHAWFLVAYCHCLSGFNRLLAGSFAEAETGGQKGLAVAEEIDHHYLKAFSLAVLSIWAGLTGQADSGKKWAEESNSITENNMMGLVLTPWGLSINYARLGRWQEASQTLAVAFKQAEDQQFPAALIWLMGTAALIAVEKGELETAVRFLSISKNHPFNATGWMAQWPRLAGLETELKQQVGEEAYETAWAEGMACEPGMLPPDILVEVSNLLHPG